jgi:hypothetical protein
LYYSKTNVSPFRSSNLIPHKGVIYIQVSQEESIIFWEVIVSLILTKKKKKAVSDIAAVIFRENGNRV